MSYLARGYCPICKELRLFKFDTLGEYCLFCAKRQPTRKSDVKGDQRPPEAQANLFELSKKIAK